MSDAALQHFINGGSAPRPEEQVVPVADEGKITCQICGATVHLIQKHLTSDHPDVTLDTYIEKYPAAPLLSEFARSRIEEIKRKREQEAAAAAPAAATEAPAVSAKPNLQTRKALADVFGLRSATSARNGSGGDIMIRVFEPSRPEDKSLVPSIDRGYIYEVGLLRLCIMAVELKLNPYLWGHAGTGKSTMWEQIAARTNRPLIRVQHNRFLEPHQVIGQMAASKERGTFFEPGPLAMAAKYGWMYCADEYDTAQPGVLMLYQAILEGKPLVIPDAPDEWRRVELHPDFFFCATGNTNGSGDETDLYSGTLTQNYANYSRFQLVQKVEYMAAQAESEILRVKVGIEKSKADALVQFATLVRQGFEEKIITAPIGPRELLAAARLAHNLNDYKAGVLLAFGNKLRGACREKVVELAERVFDTTPAKPGFSPPKATLAPDAAAATVTVTAMSAPASSWLPPPKNTGVTGSMVAAAKANKNNWS